MCFNALTRPSRFGDWLGKEVVSVDAERRTVEVRYQPREDATNRYGTLAGGALAAMLDSLTGLAALAVLPEETVAVHRALAVDYLRPAAPGPIRGVGRVLEQDERVIACEGDLFDADGQLVARGRAQLRVVRGSTASTRPETTGESP
jgi:uncharacterized protein (TIGR00369 family)